MSEELQKAAQEYSADIAIDYDLIVRERPDLHPLLAVAFEAGARWHKNRAFLEIIKDIQKSGGILIVEPVGGSGAVAVDPNAGGGVNFTRIKESAIIPEIPAGIFPEILESPLKAQDFTFPSKKYQFPNPGFPKIKKGFRGKGRKR